MTRPRSLHPALLALLLTLLTLAVFSPLVIAGQFFWDDYILLVDNVHVHAAGGLRDIWLSTKNPDYFPLTSTLFWLEWRLWGGERFPQLYHLVNILLHIGNSLLLWRIFRRLRVPGAFLIGLLFAIHPVNVESAAWIAEGKNTLSVFFMCGALLLFLQFERTRRWPVYAGALLCFLLALLAKTAVVMLPFVLLLLAWYQRRRITRQDLLRAIPFFGLSLLLGLITLSFQYGQAIRDVVVRNDPFSSRLAVAGCAAWFYLAHALFPVGITFNYPRWNIPFKNPLTFIPGVLLLVGLLLLWMRRAQLRGPLAALASYLVILFPVLGFLNIFFMRYSLVSDHWQYPAIPATLALAVALLAKATQRLPRRWVHLVAALLIAVLAIDSFTIARVYRTEESIWLDTLAHNPDSWLAHAHLGEIALARARNPAAASPDDLPLALAHLTRVTELQPDQSVGYTNLGNALLIAHRPDDALAAYSRGLAAPDASGDERSLLQFNIGSLYAKAGNFPLAESHILAALQLNPNRAPTYAPALLRLADIERQSNHPQRTEEIARALLAADPGNTAAKQLLEQLPATTATSHPSP